MEDHHIPGTGAVTPVPGLAAAYGSQLAKGSAMPVDPTFHCIADIASDGAVRSVQALVHDPRGALA